MPLSTISLTISGVLCVGLAGALIGWRVHVVDTTRWEPVEVPFPSVPSRIPAQFFTVDRPGSYEMVVKITRPPDGPHRVRAECLLGFDPGNPRWGRRAVEPPCGETPVIDLTWHLTSDDGPVVNANGDSMQVGRISGIASSGGFSIDEVDRWLGSFVTHRERRYTLNVETHTSAAALQPFAPRLVVQPSPSINHDEAVKTALVAIAAASVGTMGVTLLGLGLWLDRRRRGGT